MPEDRAATSIERALAAFIRQQISAPVLTMQGFLDIIGEDCERLGLEQVTADLQRMREASRELARFVDSLVDEPQSVRHDDEGFEAFQGRVRHELRTPLNAIKGYSELILEDLPERASSDFQVDLNRVRMLADQLLVDIEKIVVSRGQPFPSDHKSNRLEIANDLRRIVHSSERRTADPEHSSRILVVDDIAANRDLLSRRLVRDGHQAVIAEDGLAALEKVSSEEFDLVLLDLMMPGMSGFDVLCRLKSNCGTKDIPVIMISALNELDATVRCIEAGAEDFVPKPFNPALLRARIESSLEKKRLRDRERHTIEELRAEKQRSESLLLNILPRSVLFRMRNGETTIADHVSEATVLFSDLVGFTSMAKAMPPSQVLHVLSAVFSRFDEAVAELGLEKIKTIGDAYMVVGGLPDPIDAHALRVAQLALEMLDITKSLRERLDLDLQIRIGMHSGPVVAGVIGTQKFAYDVWGDTVNTASRMENSGAPGEVHVSNETRDALGAHFKFESRGAIDIKGKGVMETYFLLR
jgi:adenylate cyclase